MMDTLHICVLFNVIYIYIYIYIWVSAKLTRLTSVALLLSQKPFFLMDGFRFVEFRQFWVHFVKKTKFQKFDLFLLTGLICNALSKNIIHSARSTDKTVTVSIFR